MHQENSRWPDVRGLLADHPSPTPSVASRHQGLDLEPRGRKRSPTGTPRFSDRRTLSSPLSSRGLVSELFCPAFDHSKCVRFCCNDSLTAANHDEGLVEGEGHPHIGVDR